MKIETLHKDNTYHIFNRGINSGAIFHSDENKMYFLRILKKYLEGKADVYAYCLMDNHFHVLLTVLVEGDVVTQALSNLFNAYAKAFNKANDRTGSLFEKHFRRIKITDEDYIRRLIIYIHLNPKHHLDLDFERFKFSSYNTILSEKETTLKRSEVLNLFYNADNFREAHRQRNDILEQLTLE